MNRSNRSFQQTVKDIRDAEKCVDDVLQAARLQRNPTDYKKLQMILEYMLALVGMIFAFILLALPFILIGLQNHG